jgi:pimeloyl-ACP methyl ester carboxylesterase/ASC-1-like (ASCH) protein
MEKTGIYRKKIIKFLRNTIVPVALSLTALGCSTLEKSLLDSDMGEEAICEPEYRYINSFNKPSKIEDFGLLSRQDSSPEKPILFFILGWGGTIQEFLDEEKNGKESKLGIMKDVFDNRVVLADYSTNKSTEDTFSELEQSALELVNKYSKENQGKMPKIILAGHSMGVNISRMFERKYPQYIKKTGLIGGENDGVNLGIFTDFIKENFPRYMEMILSGKDCPPSKITSFGAHDYKCIDEIFHGSEYLNNLNTSTPPLDVEYNFYAFVSKDNNCLVPGEDDGVVNLESQYPYELIKNKKYENVKIGDVIIFKGDINHYSIDNLLALRIILESLKSEKESSYDAVSAENAIKIIIPKCPPFEQEMRNKRKNFRLEYGDLTAYLEKQFLSRFH